MKITRETVEHVARLAHLDLSEDELRLFTDQLDTILEYMAKLDDLDLDEIEATFQVVPVSCPVRDDVPRASSKKDALLSRAPDADAEYFKVPKIIG